MITKQDALTAREFHHDSETQNGGRDCYRVRRNGRTQTWVTRPDAWRIPVVHGLKGYAQIYDHDAASWHVAEQCPRLAPACHVCGRTDGPMIDLDRGTTRMCESCRADEMTGASS